MGARRQANRTGYTLVEMIIATFVIGLVAVAVVPSLISMKSTSDRRETINAIRRLPEQARQRAITIGQSTQIIYDDTAKHFEIQDMANDGTGTTAITIPLLAEIEPTRFQLAGADVAASDFKLSFTPDGRSNGGGLEFSNFSTIVKSTGSSQFIAGPLPDTTDQAWQAGNLEQRTN